jgi:hypothetical protein
MILVLISFLIFTISLLSSIILIYTYIYIENYIIEIKDKYKVLAIANFLENSSNFFTGKTAELIEETILYYNLNKKNLNTIEMADKIYEKLAGVVNEVQNLLTSAKDVFKIDSLSKDIDRFKNIFIIFSVPSIALSLIYLIITNINQDITILPYLFGIEIFSFIIYIGSIIYIESSIIKIEKELNKYKSKYVRYE